MTKLETKLSKLSFEELRALYWQARVRSLHAKRRATWERLQELIDSIEDTLKVKGWVD